MSEERFRLSDELTGALIGLAHACSNNPKTESTDFVILHALALSAECSDSDMLRSETAKVNAEKYAIVPDCATCKHPCGNTDNYDMLRLWNAPQAVRAVKTVMLLTLRQLAAEVIDIGISEEIMAYFYKSLYLLAEDWESEQLLDVLMEADVIYSRIRNFK